MRMASTIRFVHSSRDAHYNSAYTSVRLQTDVFASLWIVTIHFIFARMCFAICSDFGRFLFIFGIWNRHSPSIVTQLSIGQFAAGHCAENLLAVCFLSKCSVPVHYASVHVNRMLVSIWSDGTVFIWISIKDSTPIGTHNEVPVIPRRM